MADAEIWKDIYYVDTLSGEIVDYRGYDFPAGKPTISIVG